ncbi:uncharacterized protein E0L32_005559 [Thyridium curvatum]|uniref:Uncharacterized protein n=1 Tax=Thyridium curvatum TaxID=1093900 RepID=A0A507B3D1_9PEZI|nr:uncharacterized protein E0L32_005559 [Thyridium curvatum]TPX14363.1 hypothetical protein E0L32_005559 [Thyridium curvatum]
MGHSSVLGKRKPKATEEELEDAQAIFRKHFEAQFQLLPEDQPLRKAEGEDEEDEEDDEDDSEEDGSDAESEWDGLSGDEEDDDVTAVQVIDHSTNTHSSEDSAFTKAELRAYMVRLTSLPRTNQSSKPPSSTFPSSDDTKPPSSRRSSKPASASDEPEDSAALLANDLALQRLISESHLLAASSPHLSSSPSASKPFASGRARQAATSLRLAALGASPASLAPQHKMPMAQRKGIAAAAAAREHKRRREAKLNGVVLERPDGSGSGSGSSKGKDPRGRRRAGGGPVDAPSVGRMRGAELRLSKRDIRDVEGPRGGGDWKKKKRRSYGGEFP